jgi:predicted AAA+ superfamily ATPase
MTSSDYRHRIVDTVLDSFLMELPAVLLDGPKGVGKTTTALRRARTVRRFDRTDDRFLAEADDDWAIGGTRPVLLDEWHRVPAVWDAVKRAVDDDRSGGQFILTGSLPTSSTHSGAGRITALRMRPMTLSERGGHPPSVSLTALANGNHTVTGDTEHGLQHYVEEIFRSGFPGFRELTDSTRRAALGGYVQRIIDSDLPDLGVPRRKPASLLAWLSAYAAATATTAKWETIRQSATPGSSDPPTKVTVMGYRDALTRLRILDELPPWLPSGAPLKRFAQAPKHFLADPALAVTLLDLSARDVLGSSDRDSGSTYKPLVGRLFEALAVLSVRVYAEGMGASVSHFRDVDGRREVDLIVQLPNGAIIPIEIKMGQTVTTSDTKHLTWLREALPDKVLDSMVLYSGRRAFRQDGIAIVPLSLLGP